MSPSRPQLAVLTAQLALPPTRPSRRAVKRMGEDQLAQLAGLARDIALHRGDADMQVGHGRRGAVGQSGCLGCHRRSGGAAVGGPQPTCLDSAVWAAAACRCRNAHPSTAALLCAPAHFPNP